jgi:hypothetical protein
MAARGGFHLESDVLVGGEAEDVARGVRVVGVVDVADACAGFDEEEGELVGSG